MDQPTALTFFYILYRKKILESRIFSTQIFDGFTRFGISEDDFTVYTKCLSACDANFVVELAQLHNGWKCKYSAMEWKN